MQRHEPLKAVPAPGTDGTPQSTRSQAPRLIRALAAALAVATLFGVLGIVGDPASAAPSAPTGCTGNAASYASESESIFVSKLNALRQSKGLRTLVVNSTITEQARSWSRTMSQQIRPGGSSADPGWLHHARDTGPDDGVEPDQDYVYLIGLAVPHWTRAAENVGVSDMYSWCTDAEARDAVLKATSGLHDAFVRSSGHYANMVGDHNQVGIGVEIRNNELWVTVRFANGDLPKTPMVYPSTSQYLDAVYNLFVNRPANSYEDSYWASAVQSGNRLAVTRGLSVSDEWAGVRVNDLYRKVLGRDADSAGRAFWVNKIARGMRLEDVAAAMYASSEYYTRKGGSDTGFVTGLFQDILHRSPDSDGLRYWNTLLYWKLIDRSGVAANFYASIESRRDRVTTLYRDVLGRGTDPAGREYWAGQLLGMGDVVLAAQLAASQEFFTSATA